MSKETDKTFSEMIEDLDITDPQEVAIVGMQAQALLIYERARVSNAIHVLLALLTLFAFLALPAALVAAWVCTVRYIL